MKTANTIMAVAALATTTLATHIHPVKVEARATSTATSSATLPTITTKGNAFFNGTDRFYIRGVDYQPGGSSDATDPLADYATCSRDIPYFQKLGLNTIRVYTVDNSKNHDECMNALAAAGIYLALDVNTPKYSLNRDSPGESYNPTYLQSIFATIDVFSNYTNTLLFFSGNEVINTADSTTAAPYVKVSFFNISTRILCARLAVEGPVARAESSSLKTANGVLADRQAQGGFRPCTSVSQLTYQAYCFNPLSIS